MNAVHEDVRLLHALYPTLQVTISPWWAAKAARSALWYIRAYVAHGGDLVVKIAVVGIGGIGGYLGGRLANAYTAGSNHEIVFVEKSPAHLDAIKRDGLKLLAKDGDATVRHSMVTDSPSALGKVDVVLLCTKGYDLLEAAKVLEKAVYP